MFSGKTEEAGIRATIAQYSGGKWLLLRPERSIRKGSSGELITHGGQRFSAISIDCALKAKNLVIPLIKNKEIDLVWIDEPFLFVNEDKNEILDLVFSVLEVCDVLVSTLSRTDQGDWWPFIGEIMCKADDIIDCKRAVCMRCKALGATRTIYVGDEIKGEKEKVGGESYYQPVCLHCWNKHMISIGAVDDNSIKDPKQCNATPYQ